MLLLGLLAGAANAEPLTTVSVDLGGLDDATYRRLNALSLEQRVVLRLVQDDFAVVASAAPAEVRLSIRAAGPVLALRAESARATRQTEVQTRGVGAAELALEVAQKAAELVQACAPPRRVEASSPPAPAPSASPNPPVAAPASVGVAAAPPAEPPAPAQAAIALTLSPRPAALSALTVSVSPGLSFRAGGLDPAARLELRYGQRWGVRALAGVSPALASGLWVLEAKLLVGPGLELQLSPRVWLDVSACLGAQLHAFRDDGAAPAHSGASFAFAAAAPVALTFWPQERFGIGLQVTPGWVSSQPTHGAQWVRGPVSFDAAAVAVVRL